MIKLNGRQKPPKNDTSDVNTDWANTASHNY